MKRERDLVFSRPGRSILGEQEGDSWWDENKQIVFVPLRPIQVSE